ncbi:hypothetical protein ACKXGF_14395 (plasmid) [Alkalibacillus sp. S2W]|uniref:hypothetical protein n=1 Tax=Alkalibacillus sp. S2W TaxID=3386553 RepID=UPI00398CF94A
MYKNTVFLFKKEEYRNYIEQRKSDGINVVTFPGLDLVDLYEDVFDLDLTSVLQAVKNGVITKYQVDVFCKRKIHSFAIKNT